MSNIPVIPATPAVAAVPINPGNIARNVLPEGLKVDSGHSADGFFEAHKAANPPSGSPAPTAVIPAAAAPVPVVQVQSDPAKGSLVEKLAAKNRPPAAPPPAASPAGPIPAAGVKNPEDDIVLAPGYSAPAHESFAKIKTITVGLREQLVTAREEARTFKVQLDAVKAGAPVADTAELDRLRAEHKTMSDRLMLVDLREHPRFQTEFIAPQQAALTAAAELLAAGGVQGVDVAGLLSKPRAEFGKAVSEAAARLSDFDRTDFAENMRKAWGISQQAASALTKSRETYSAIRNQSDSAQKQAFERTWGRAAGAITEHIMELDAPDNATPDQRAEVDTYNAALKGLRMTAEQRAFAPASAEAVAEAAIKSAAYDFHIQQALPRVIKEYDALLTLNRQLSAELTAIRGRNPNRQISGAPAGGAGGGGNADGTLSHDQLSKMSHADAAAALAPRR